VDQDEQDLSPGHFSPHIESKSRTPVCTSSGFISFALFGAKGEAHFLTLALSCQTFYRNTSLLVSRTRFLLPRRLHTIRVGPAGSARYATVREPPRRVCSIDARVEATTFTLKLRKIGNSVGLVLPKEMLTRLNIMAGQSIFAVETHGGYSLTAVDPAVGKQIDAGIQLMDRHGEVFVELAK
jgi:putative addiction module antidote